VSVYDPWADEKEVMHEYGLEIYTKLPNKSFDTVVLGVAHNEFLDLDYKSLQKSNAVLFDVKGILSIPVDGSL
jgi:UDP-N-acetyl-D-galactosamine dehydrogenase